jgi:hypothetical protein
MQMEPEQHRRSSSSSSSRHSSRLRASYACHLELACLIQPAIHVCPCDAGEEEEDKVKSDRVSRLPYLGVWGQRGGEPPVLIRVAPTVHGPCIDARRKVSSLPVMVDQSDQRSEHGGPADLGTVCLVGSTGLSELLHAAPSCAMRAGHALICVDACVGYLR